VDRQGGLWAWGSGHAQSPEKLEIPEFFISVAAGLNHSLALTKDGDVYS
jgi:alpha-tubulin suppressor-like RCC1 family protein